MQRVLLHSGIQVVGRALSAFGGIISIWIITRYLGPSMFGAYTLVGGYLAIATIFGDLGLQSVGIGEMARLPERRSIIVGQLLTLRLALSVLVIVATVAILVVAPYPALQSPGIRVAIGLAAIELLFVPFQAVATAVFQISIAMSVPTLGEVLGRLLSLGLIGLVVGLTLAGFRFSFDARLWLIVGAGMVGAVFTSLFLRWKASLLIPIRPVWDTVLARSMLAAALPITVYLILGYANYRSDIFLLSAMRRIDVVGVYGVAISFLDTAVGVGGMVMGLFFPLLARGLASDRVLLVSTFRRAYDLMLLFGTAGALFISCLAPILVPLVAGPHFGGAILPSSVIAWAIPVIFVEYLVTQMLIVGKRMPSAIQFVLLGALINIGLSVVLIPRVGAVGPCIAIIISHTVTTAGMLWLVRRHFTLLPSLSVTVRVALAAAATFLVFIALARFFSPFAPAWALTLFGVSLPALRLITARDMATVLSRQV